MMVNGGCVAEVLTVVRQHGLQHLGQQRCGCIVIEIDASHHPVLLYWGCRYARIVKKWLSQGRRRGKPRLYGYLFQPNRYQCPWANCGECSVRVNFTSAQPRAGTLTGLLQIIASEKTGRFKRTWVA